MSQDMRRKMIVRAVLPLVIEHGAAVTTAQVARVAGIGEGTVFRAFKDKNELIEACVLEALCPDDVLRAVAEISLDQPLADRLEEAADALSAHLRRIGAMVAAMQTSGRPPTRGPDAPRPDRRQSFLAVRGAVAELFEPDRDRLRLPAEQLGRIFLSMPLSRVRDDQQARAAELVDAFLNGAVTA